MAALTGQSFIDSLNELTARASMPDSARIWYSFWPEHAQSDYKFVFNSLLDYSQHFLKMVTGASVETSSKYPEGETPDVTFVANNDVGSGASGTALMGVIISHSFDITGIEITNQGRYYRNAPTILITPPLGGGAVPTATVLLTYDTGRIYSDSYPGFSVGCHANVITGMASGTGHFSQGLNNYLRIGDRINFNDWTAFINFSHSGYTNGKSRVLFSTMDSENQTSGFMLGINDSNRLFLEYIDNTTYGSPTRRINTHNCELNAYNLISLSKNNANKTMTICSHNLAKHGLFASVYNLAGYQDNNLAYLGGFLNSNNNANYTGYCGNIYDFLLLSGAATSDQSDLIAKSFFITGYTPVGYTSTTTQYTGITGARYENTVIDYGQTGIELGITTISSVCGPTIDTFREVPLMGDITGYNIVYLSGVTEITRSGDILQNEQFLYDYPYLKKYTDNNLILLNTPCGASDVLEIYNFPSKQVNKISIKPEFFNIYDYSSDSTLNPAIIYKAGLLQVRGISYPNLRGNTPVGPYCSVYDYLLYDTISGQTTASGFVGASGTITADLTIGGVYDLYVNGEKMTSGFDYTLGGSYHVVIKSGQVWNSGFMAFAPIKSERVVSLDSGIGYRKQVATFIDEMVWFNGQRLVWDSDYKTVPDSSLISNGLRVPACSSPYYVGDDFPLSVLTGLPAYGPNYH